MKKLSILLFVLLGNVLLAQEPTTFTDPRDGKEYQIVSIGDQVWMAENLAFRMTGVTTIGNRLSNVETYGYLYNWEMASKACPTGWHLPTQAEWGKLQRFTKNTGTLRAEGAWEDETTDEFGFSALPGGFINRQQFGFGNTAAWWSSTQKKNDSAIAVILENMMSHRFMLPRHSIQVMASVRCIKD